MLFILFDYLYSSLKIPEIIKSIEHTKNIDPVIASSLNECFHNVIGIIAVTYNILTPEQHRERSFLNIFFKCSDPFPGIFIQESVHCIKSSSTPYFHGIESNFIHPLSHWQHVFCPATGSKNTLMSIAETKILYLDRVFCFWPIWIIIHLRHFQNAMCIKFHFSSIIMQKRKSASTLSHFHASPFKISSLH